MTKESKKPAGTKAAALEAAAAKSKSASARWDKAVPTEKRAFQNAQDGDQMNRIAHALALQELVLAHTLLHEAEAARKAAEALPEDA